MRKIILILMIFLFIITFAFDVEARECQPIEDVNSACDILVFAVNSSDLTQIFTDANCTISTYNPSGSVDADRISMSHGYHGNGWYNYTFNEATTGVWKLDLLCSKNGFNSRSSGIITVDISDQERMEELNDTTQIILIDTAELQTNQADWDTATGFSTHSADDVKVLIANNITSEHGTGSYTSISTSGLATNDKIDELNDSIRTYGDSNWATATGFTTDSDLVPLCQQNNLTDGIVVLTSGTETQIDNIEVDTNEIQGNQSNMVTATGFSTHSADNVKVLVADNITGEHGSGAYTTADLSSVALEATVKEVNNTVQDSTYGLSALKTLIDGLPSLSEIIAGLFNGVIGQSSKSLNETLGDVYNVTITQQDGYNGNWSDSGGVAVISDGDMQKIASYTRNETTAKNISDQCPWGGNITDDIEAYIACGYQRGWQ